MWIRIPSAIPIIIPRNSADLSACSHQSANVEFIIKSGPWVSVNILSILLGFFPIITQKTKNVNRRTK